MSSYLAPLMQPESLIERAAKAASFIKQIKPDILVGTGTSGIISCTAVSMASGVPMMIVRKGTDNDNHGIRYETPEDFDFRTWVLVDDFVSSGRTFCKVFEAVASNFASVNPVCLGVVSTIPMDCAHRVFCQTIEYPVYKFNQTTPMVGPHAPVRKQHRRRRHIDERQMFLPLGAGLAA